jgi:catechol 2,3-dioxygenase-like lactoylglutathione lyase family enzyme
MAWKLGHVGHFGLAVRDPKRSAAWWIDNLGLEKQFTFDDAIAIGNETITIVLHPGVPHPGTFGHMSFHLPSLEALRAALTDLRERDVELEDPGDEIGPEAPGSPHMGLWFHDPDGYRWELSVQNAAKGGRR